MIEKQRLLRVGMEQEVFELVPPRFPLFAFSPLEFWGASKTGVLVPSLFWTVAAHILAKTSRSVLGSEGLA